MKKFDISKQKADKVQGLYSLMLQKQTIIGLLEKEIQDFVRSEILPDIGLEPKDFKYINLDIASGVVNFDDKKKKEEEKEVDSIAKKEK